MRFRQKKFISNILTITTIAASRREFFDSNLITTQFIKFGIATAAEKAIKAICNGHIKNYEDLANCVPSGVSTEAVLALLSQASKQAIDLDTPSGRITLGGAQLTRKLLGCRSTTQVLVDVRAIGEDGAPNGTVSFRLELPKTVNTELPDFLRNKRRVSAALQTGSDSKALALLHFAKVHGSLVKLDLQMTYQILERS